VRVCVVDEVIVVTLDVIGIVMLRTDSKTAKLHVRRVTALLIPRMLDPNMMVRRAVMQLAMRLMQATSPVVVINVLSQRLPQESASPPGHRRCSDGRSAHVSEMRLRPARAVRHGSSGAGGSEERRAARGDGVRGGSGAGTRSREAAAAHDGDRTARR